MDNYQEQYKKMIMQRERININLTEKRRNALKCTPFSRHRKKNLC